MGNKLELVKLKLNNNDILTLFQILNSNNFKYYITPLSHDNILCIEIIESFVNLVGSPIPITNFNKKLCPIYDDSSSEKLKELINGSEKMDSVVLLVDDKMLKSEIRSEKINIIETLIKNKCTIENKYIDYALQFNSVAVIKYLIDENYEINYFESIKLAIKYECEEIQEMLINACPNREEKLLEFDEDNNSLLHHAAEFGQIDLLNSKIFTDLMLNKDFFYKKNSKGQQAVHCIEIDDIELGELLINTENINATDRNNWTPLHYFVSKNLFELAEFVIKEGALINEENSLKESPLYMACTKGSYEMVKLLIENKANIDKEGEDKVYKDILTPLMASISSWNFDMNILNLLLSKNVKTCTEVFGKNALHMAIQTGNYQIVEALVDKEKSLGIKYDDGKSPLDLANQLYSENHIIIKLLLFKEDETKEEEAKEAEAKKAEAKKAKKAKSNKKKKLKKSVEDLMIKQNLKRQRR